MHPKESIKENQNASSQGRTSQYHVSEMLTVARTIITDASGKLPTTEWLIRVYLVAVGQGTKSARYFRDILWVVAIGCENIEGALIRNEMAGFWSGIFWNHLNTSY